MTNIEPTKAQHLDLTVLFANAQIYASSVASPHHMTFSVEALRSLIEDYTQAAAQAVQAVPVAWADHDLDGMVEAFSRVIEAQHSKDHPFHQPINSDAMTALRVLRGFIPTMKAMLYAAPQPPANITLTLNPSGDHHG